MGAREDLNNPNLFEENKPGDYTYAETAHGKSAKGQLYISDSPQRDSEAQRNAGGESRRRTGNEYGVDDGGHMIGARFGGATGEENLTPQDRNINRQAYKNIENSWAEHLEAGDKVYVNMESYEHDGGERPTNYMGYAIIEHTDEQGNVTREVEYYSLNNESRMTQEGWQEEEDQFYAENPGYVEEQMQENTAMQYIWDEEKGEAVENPNYVPEAEAETEQDLSAEEEESFTPEEEVQAKLGEESYVPEETAEEEAVAEVEEEESYLPEEELQTEEAETLETLSEVYAENSEETLLETSVEEELVSEADYTPEPEAEEAAEVENYAPEGGLTVTVNNETVYEYHVYEGSAYE